MDLISYAKGIGDNKIFVYIDLPDQLEFDVTLTNPCNTETKDATIGATECNGYYEVNFQGVESMYEDLDAGLIYFELLGTWKAEFYKSGATKIPSNLLKTILLHINTLS